jgi:hypothetical protein
VSTIWDRLNPDLALTDDQLLCPDEVHSPMGIMASAVKTSGMFERAALPVGFSSLTSCAASTRARAITKGSAGVRSLRSPTKRGNRASICCSFNLDGIVKLAKYGCSRRARPRLRARAGHVDGNVTTLGPEGPSFRPRGCLSMASRGPSRQALRTRRDRELRVVLDFGNCFSSASPNPMRINHVRPLRL